MSVVLAVLALHANAQQAPPQQAPSPEQLKQIMQSTMGAMVSVIGPMTDAAIEAQLNTAAKPETAARIATFKKNLYDALLKQGFEPQFRALRLYSVEPRLLHQSMGL